MKKLIKCSKEIPPAALVVEKILDVYGPEAMCFERSLPAQPSRIGVTKVRSPESVASLMHSLRSFLSRCGADSSEN